MKHEGLDTASLPFELVEGPKRRSRKKRAEYRLALLLLLLVLLAPAAIASYDWGALPTWYLAFSPIIAIVLLIAWLDRREWHSTNSVRVDSTGICPPFKTGRHRGLGEWYVPLSEIERFERLKESGGIAVFSVYLRNGEVFQLNPLDLLEYADEAAIRRYSRAIEALFDRIPSTIS